MNLMGQILTTGWVELSVTAVFVCATTIFLLFSRPNRASRLKSSLKQIPVRRALVFAIISFVWIAGTDLALTRWVSDIHLLRSLSIEKSWAFVIATTLVLYSMARLDLRRWEEAIAARKAAEETRKLWADAFENCAHGVALGLPSTGRIMTCNRAFANLLGYTVAELTGARILDMYDSTEQERVTELIAEADQTGSIQYETRMRRKDGYLFPALVDLVSVRDAKNVPQYRVATFLNLSELKQAATQLRNLYRAVEQSPAIIMITSSRGEIEYVNPQFTRITGYSLEEVRGKSPRVLKSGETPAEEYSNLWKSITSGLEWRGEFHNKKKSGELYWESALVSPIVDENGKIAHFLGVKEDITLRKQTEEILRRQASLFDQTYDAMVIWEWNKGITFWNRGAERLYGHMSAEAMGVEPHILLKTVAPEGREKLRAAVENNAFWEGVLEQSARDGHRILVESRIHLLRERDRSFAMAVNRDVTARQQLEDQLRQSQKMEGIGQLAGGVAHDFNNLLSVILGYSDILRGHADLGEMRRPIEQIHSAAQRAALLTRQLLAFSRKQLLQPRAINLNSLATDLEKMLSRLVGENIKIKLQLEAALGTVSADPGQIEQAIMNLVINSRDAMPSGGKITIRTESLVLDQEYQRRHPWAKPGSYVMLEVADNGMGMSKSTQAQIFEPFFTTKKEGTGLGLATVFGIVKQSGGSIEVTSELGKGSAFKIYLPRVEKVVQPQEARQLDLPTTASETILLVEDDNDLRAVTRELLEIEGYRILEAPNGEEALRISHGHDEKIDLLLTDVMMPGMDGIQLAEKVRKHRPRIRILFMTGYSHKNVYPRSLANSTAAVLEKPFEKESLTRRVRETLFPN